MKKILFLIVLMLIPFVSSAEFANPITDNTDAIGATDSISADIGVKIYSKLQQNLTQIDLHSLTQASRLYIKDEAGSVLSTYIVSGGGNLTIANFILEKDTIYRIEVDQLGSVFTARVSATDTLFPMSRTNINYLNSSIAGANSSITFLYEILSMTTQEELLSVNLGVPTNATITAEVPLTFNATITSPNSELDNATLYIWNEDGTLNSTNTTTITGLSNVSTFEHTIEELDNYLWNIQGCNATSCVFADLNRTLDYGYKINEVVYNSIVAETDSQSFVVNVTLIDSITTSTAVLNYNGTEYLATKVDDGANVIFTSEIDVPTVTVSTNYTFFWNFTLNDEYFKSDDYTQQVDPIVIHLCDATYTTPTINFTIYDEINNTEINSSFQTAFSYWIGSGNLTKNYTYSNLVGNMSKYSFCVTPTTFNDTNPLYVNLDLEYGKTGFDDREYFLRESLLTNESSIVDLYLLDSTLSTKFFGTVQKGVSTLANALVVVKKYFVGDGIYKTISIRKTDSDGEFVEYLEEDKQYEYTIIEDGASLGTIQKTSICESAPCSFTLQVLDAELDAYSGYYDTYAQSITYDLDYDDTTKIVTFSYTDLTGLAQYARLIVSRSSLNETGETICDSNVYSTSGTILCNMTGYDGNFKAQTYISRSPEQLIDTINFVVDELKDTLGSTGLLVSLLILLTVMMVLAKNSDPITATVAIPITLTFTKMAGFLTISWTIIIVLYILIGVLLTIKES